MSDDQFEAFAHDLCEVMAKHDVSMANATVSLPNVHGILNLAANHTRCYGYDSDQREQRDYSVGQVPRAR